jgi:hypothetical protein
MGFYLLFQSGMKTYTRILALSLGFIFSIAVTAEAQRGDAQTASAAPKNPSSVTTDAAPDVDDPVAAWVEKNAGRLGLYMDESDVSEAPPKVKSAPTYKANSLSKLKTNAVMIRPDELGPLPVRLNTDADPIEALYLKQRQTGTAGKRTSEPTDVIDLSPKEAAAQIKESLDEVLDVGDACDNFVTEKGFGPLGQIVIRETLKAENRELIEGPLDVRSSRLCPNFDALSARAKAYFWVFVKSAVTFLESSCDPLKGSGRVAIVKGRRVLYKRVKGPNGFASGLLALHEGREDQYGAQNCVKDDAKSASRSVICGVSMLTEQIKRRFNLFTNHAYFGVLLPKGDSVKMKDGSRKRVQIAKGIVAGIRMLPFCGYNGPGAKRTMTASQSSEQESIAPAARASSYGTVQ